MNRYITIVKQDLNEIHKKYNKSLFNLFCFYAYDGNTGVLRNVPGLYTERVGGGGGGTIL